MKFFRIFTFFLVVIFLLFSFEIFAQNKIKYIRAQCIFSNQYASNFKKLFKLKKFFKQDGLIFVEKNPDILFCAEVTDHILSLKKPIIILERWSSATLLAQTKEALKQELVLGVLKNRILRSKNLYNTPSCRGRYHFYLMNEYAHFGGEEKFEYIAKSFLKKIYCVPWDYETSNFATKILNLKHKKVDLKKNRPIDVFFAGNVYHEPTSIETNKWYYWHRKKAIDAINSMSDIKTLVYAGRPLPFDEYIKKIHQSKIVVSPWGLGEWCYKDIEAMLLGAIVIKPDTSFVITEPDMFNKNKLYITCKPDFSDLSEKISNILVDFSKYTSMRRKAKEFFKDLNFSRLSKLFVDRVRELLNEYNKKYT